jgi:RNA polymerase sigma-70 factor, ECF subfamily
MVDDLERSVAVDGAYREHAPELYRLAFGILRDRDAAVDATQVAFARAYERWAQHDPSRPLLPWLHGIVVHEALDALRRRRVRWIAAAAMPGRERGSRSPGSDLAAQVAERAAINEGRAELKPMARAAVLLRHLYGYDYAEIARLIGTSPGNVGSLLSRAHAQLRELLAELGPEPDARTNPTTTPLDEPR